MTVAIKVENLSKKYIIRHEKKSAHYETLSESLIQGGKDIANRILHPFTALKKDGLKQEEFWALKDINFEVNQGDKVGIIGRNGAGKSTLLKVLSRITEPTSGKIHINGRIASLLEVGTGFHPELTGRENIFLNGAILGMSRKEIRLKFDEIVAFAEVEKFLDTPVKRYSSGMYVRLAFAVAAHLESEILVVDEVLAVGDVEFQKKCLGKMDEVSKGGRTIIFVSHNMSAIQEICTKLAVIEGGRVAYKDSVVSGVNEYLKVSASLAGAVNFTNNERKRTPRFSRFQVQNLEGEVTPSFRSGDVMVFKTLVDTNEIVRDPIFSLRISDSNGVNILTWRSNDYVSGPLPKNIDSHFKITITTYELYLLNGVYDISIGFANGNEILDTRMKFCSFEIKASKPSAEYHVLTKEKSSNSLIFSPAEWKVNV